MVQNVAGRRGPPPSNVVRDNWIRQQHQQGKSQVDIANAEGLSRQRVSQIVHAGTDTPPEPAK